MAPGSAPPMAPGSAPPIQPQAAPRKSITVKHPSSFTHNNQLPTLLQLKPRPQHQHLAGVNSHQCLAMHVAPRHPQLAVRDASTKLNQPQHTHHAPSPSSSPPPSSCTARHCLPRHGWRRRRRGCNSHLGPSLQLLHTRHARRRTGSAPLRHARCHRHASRPNVLGSKDVRPLQDGPPHQAALRSRGCARGLPRWPVGCLQRRRCR